MGLLEPWVPDVAPGQGSYASVVALCILLTPTPRPLSFVLCMIFTHDGPVVLLFQDSDVPLDF